jgi:hypothetical protein
MPATRSYHRQNPASDLPQMPCPPATHPASPRAPAAGRLLATGLLALLLGACSTPEDPVELLADYTLSVARLQNGAAPAIAPTQVPTWPAVRDVQQPVTDIRVSLPEFLDFGRCGLLREISERNSSLGRVQAPSQRLLYEMRFLRGIQQCAQLTHTDLEHPDADRREFAEGVRRVEEIKRRDLPANYWNATFGAPELREFFNVAARPLRLREDVPVNSVANAISWLAGLGRLSGDAPLPATDALEMQYYQLVGNKLGARLWHGLDISTRELDRVSALIEDADTKRLCPGGHPTRQAQQLYNVFTDRYVQRLQPWIAVNARHADTLSQALEQLWRAQQVSPPPAMHQYRSRTFADAPDALRGRLDTALRRHAAAWGNLLGACGLAPAQKP